MRVSAALIVKNEEANLGRCLGSIRNLVDEIVVVDTGSTDRTKDIAKEFGATIASFEWCDDFSAARNASLEMLTGDWMLSVDADHEVHAEPGWRDALAGDVTTGLVFEKDARLGGKVKVPKLFRLMPGLRWVRPIHEMVSFPCPEVVADLSSQIEFLHYGYTPELSPAKIERNIELLQRDLQRGPNADSLFYLSRECSYAGRFEEGLNAARELLELDLSASQRSEAYAIAAWNAAGMRNFPQCIEISKQARMAGVPSIVSEYVRALAFGNTGNASKALEAAHRACAMPPPESSATGLHEVWNSLRFKLLEALQRR